MRNLSKYFFFIVTLLSTTLVDGQFKKFTKDVSFVNESYLFINGKINNYHPTSNNGFITFRTYTLYGQRKDTSIYIKKDGAFRIKLLQAFEGDFAIMFADRYLDLYYMPNESLYIQIDETKWSDPEKMSAAISLSGKAARISKMVTNFTNAYTKKEFMTVYWSDSTKSDNEVSLQRINRMYEEKTFLYNYLKNNNIKDVKFKKWAENYIAYNAGQDITFENFTSLRKKSLAIDQLMNVLKDIKVNNPEALNTSSYYSFLHMLQGAFQIIVNINPSYKDSIKINGLSPVPVYTHYIDQYSYGIAKQLLYFDLYRMIVNPNFDYLFDNVLLDRGLKKQFNILKNKKNQSFVPFNVMDRLRSAKIDSSTKNKLMHIFENSPDSFLYVDFWGTWCAPCMQEMPFYPRLISKLEKKNIKFLFLAVSTEENDALKIKDKYKIAAEFLVLNDNEAKAINNILQFSSYPNHFLISPKGIVIGNNIPRIATGNEFNQIVVDKIDSLLVK